MQKVQRIIAYNMKKYTKYQKCYLEYLVSSFYVIKSMKSCIKIRIPVIARFTEGTSSEDSRLEEPMHKTISYNDSANKRLCYRTKKRVYCILDYVKPNNQPYKWKPSFSSWYFCTLQAYCCSFGNSYLWIIAFPSSINLQKS